MGLVTATNGEPDMKVVGEVENGDEALEACRRHTPDVIVLDLRIGSFSILLKNQLAVDMGNPRFRRENRNSHQQKRNREQSKFFH